MKNLAKLVGIIAMVALIGFTMAACNNDPDDGGKDALDGTTWRGSSTYEGNTTTTVLTFSSPNFTWSVIDGGETMSIPGTYSISGSTVTLTLIMGDETGEQTGTLSGNTLTISGLVFTKQ
jgi:predicted small secreted protein